MGTIKTSIWRVFSRKERMSSRRRLLNSTCWWMKKERSDLSGEKTKGKRIGAGSGCKQGQRRNKGGGTSYLSKKKKRERQGKPWRRKEKRQHTRRKWQSLRKLKGRARKDKEQMMLKIGIGWS